MSLLSTTKQIVVSKYFDSMYNIYFSFYFSVAFHFYLFTFTSFPASAYRQTTSAPRTLVRPQPTPKLTVGNRPAEQPHLLGPLRKQTRVPSRGNRRSREPHRPPSVVEHLGNATGRHR